MRSAGIGLLACLLASCNSSDNPIGADGATAGELPRNFHLTGTATGTDDAGTTANCSLDLIFELTSEVARTAERVDYAGVHGGGVERSVLAPDGSGFAFVADVFGDVEAHLFATGRVELVIPVNATAEGRFWQNLARFEGDVDGSGQGRGSWTCAPFDIESAGYVDDSAVAQGTWQFEPEAPEETGARLTPGAASPGEANPTS